MVHVSLKQILNFVYINDIVNTMQNCNICLLADDTCLFIEIDNRNPAEERLNDDLNHIHDWAIKQLINVGAPKTQTLTIQYNTIDICNAPIYPYKCYRHRNEYNIHTCTN